ncbi:MAG TPA: TetR/AcrR family transcriptional regulator [Spirochaetales bacterium]|nr:TetR/AcrR family transcriptional regulator [Spirochaetales bacterium]
MGRKEKKTTKINREKILVTAARLIKEGGVANISLSDIARAVKISKGTLYYYYPSKHDLVFDIAEQSMNQMTEKILQWVEKSKEDVQPEEILKIVFDTIIRARGRGQIHFYLMLEALSDESLRKRFCEEYKKWREMIQEGLDRILPQGTNNPLLSQIILASIYGFLLQTLLGMEKPPLDPISRFLVAADLNVKTPYESDSPGSV